MTLRAKYTKSVQGMVTSITDFDGYILKDLEQSDSSAL